MLTASPSPSVIAQVREHYNHYTRARNIFTDERQILREMPSTLRNGSHAIEHALIACNHSIRCGRAQAWYCTSSAEGSLSSMNAKSE